MTETHKTPRKRGPRKKRTSSLVRSSINVMTSKRSLIFFSILLVFGLAEHFLGESTIIKFISDLLKFVFLSSL